MDNNDTVSLELSINEVNAILAGLSEMPFKQVADLFNKIHIQVNSQIAARQQAGQNNDSNEVSPTDTPTGE